MAKKSFLLAVALFCAGSAMAAGPGDAGGQPGWGQWAYNGMMAVPGHNKAAMEYKSIKAIAAAAFLSSATYQALAARRDVKLDETRSLESVETTAASFLRWKVVRKFFANLLRGVTFQKKEKGRALNSLTAWAMLITTVSGVGAALS